MTTFDVAVIGGGLAGCSAAIALADLGINVVLLEAKTFPHHKVCGEFLSHMSIEYLRTLGVSPQIYAAKPALIKDVTVTAPNEASWRAPLPSKGLGISRWTLDDILAQRARTVGVHLLEKVKVLAVQGKLEDGFVLTARSEGKLQTFKARAVIGAFGKFSNLDRVLKRRSALKPNNFVALKNHFFGPSLHDQIELHTFPGGYCGLSNVEDSRINLCLLVRQSTFRQVSNGDITKFITWMRSQSKRLDTWLHEASPLNHAWLSISQVSFSPRTVIDRDLVMVGDAAGLIAPLAGDGMEMAIRGGQMAARAVNRFLIQEWSASDLRHQYQREWHSTFKTRLALARILQSVMLNPSLLAMGLHVLNHIPSLGDFIVKQTRDMKPTVSSGE